MAIDASSGMSAFSMSLVHGKAHGRRGVRWFHTGGIYTLISDKAASSCTEALICAGKHIRKFLLQFRPLEREDLP